MCFTVRNGDGYADLEQNYAYYAPNAHDYAKPGGGGNGLPPGFAYSVRNMRNFALNLRSRLHYAQ